MKVIGFICLAFFACALLVAAAADTCAQTGKVGAFPKVEQKADKFKCAKDKSGTTVCQRPAPKGKAGGVYTEKATAKGRSCRWKCTVERGVEVCRGSGNECNGKVPPHWISITR